MIDTIVQEVRESRAQIAADFDYDRAKFWAWARGQQAAERKAKHQLPTSPNRVEVTGLRPSPLPHHPACGSAPGGSSQIIEL